MAGSTDVFDVDDSLGQDFALEAQEEVVDVRIANARREDDSGQVRFVGIGRIPACDVALGLRLPGRTLVGMVGGPLNVGRDRGVLRANSVWRRDAVADRGSIDHVVPLLPNPSTEYQVKGVIGEVPARVGKRVVQGTLVGHAKSAAQ